MVIAHVRDRTIWVTSTLLVGVTVITGCSPSTSGPTAVTMTAAVGASPSPTPSPTGLSGNAWATQVCARALVVQPVLERQSPGGELDPTSQDVAELQAWLAERATAQRDLAEALAEPLSADFADAAPWVREQADALVWNAIFNENIRTVMASLSPQDATAYWAQVDDRMDPRYDAAAADAVVPSPSPVPTQPSADGSRQMDELEVYLDQHADCSQLLGEQTHAGA